MLSGAGSANAAGFALIEQSASGMGNAFAGAAAVAEDPSTLFFNPAGMTHLQGRQFTAALHAIRPTAHFENDGSSAGLGRPLGSDGGDMGSLAFIPNLYYSMEVSPDMWLGLGINSPFGLKTDYRRDWIGRFQADKSSLQTLNINPSIAFKVNDRLSLGAGVSAMKINAELTRAVNQVAAESTPVKITGDDWGYGYNLGALLQLTDDTRLGLAWRSKVEQHIDGHVSFPTALAALNGGVKADLTLPETFSVSTFTHLNERWDLLLDATWTRWSRFKELRIVRDSGATLASTQENWHNTLRYSIGVNYRYSPAWKWRAGLAYDNEAIQNDYRTARIPGNDRTWVSLGASWTLSPASSADFGYAHLFIQDASIDDDQTASFNGLLKGKYSGHVDILSAQYTYRF